MKKLSMYPLHFTVLFILETLGPLLGTEAIYVTAFYEIYVHSTD